MSVWSSDRGGIDRGSIVAEREAKLLEARGWRMAGGGGGQNLVFSGVFSSAFWHSGVFFLFGFLGFGVPFLGMTTTYVTKDGPSMRAHGFRQETCYIWS